MIGTYGNKVKTHVFMVSAFIRSYSSKSDSKQNDYPKFTIASNLKTISFLFKPTLNLIFIVFEFNCIDSEIPL